VRYEVNCQAKCKPHAMGIRAAVLFAGRPAHPKGNGVEPLWSTRDEGDGGKASSLS
jgi:hypothetical protein